MHTLSKCITPFFQEEVGAAFSFQRDSCQILISAQQRLFHLLPVVLKLLKRNNFRDGGLANIFTNCCISEGKQMAHLALTEAARAISAF